jgi:hypothetical protein
MALLLRSGVRLARSVTGLAVRTTGLARPLGARALCNGLSTSDFIGVQFNGSSRKWESTILVDGSAVKGGTFDKEEDAARSYDVLARVFEGEDAVTNFKLELPTWQVRDYDGDADADDLIPVRVG